MRVLRQSNVVVESLHTALFVDSHALHTAGASPEGSRPGSSRYWVGGGGSVADAAAAGSGGAHMPRSSPKAGGGGEGRYSGIPPPPPSGGEGGGVAEGGGEGGGEGRMTDQRMTATPPTTARPKCNSSQRVCMSRASSHSSQTLASPTRCVGCEKTHMIACSRIHETF